MTWEAAARGIPRRRTRPNDPWRRWVAAGFSIRHAELPFWEFVHGD